MANTRLRRRLRGLNDELTSKPDAALLDTLHIPEKFVSPVNRIVRRVLYAFGALMAAVLIVYIDRSGYRDVQDNELSFLDCLYYATVSLSTTGYGDITPYAPSARLVNVLVITPLRVAFLIVLIGTTVETLTAASRQAFNIQRWRKSVRNHTIVVGYGTKGKTAVAAMIGDGTPPGDIVVVDTDQATLERAAVAGLVTVKGDANRADVLRLAGAQHAAAIIASIRESENQHLLKQSGADSVVVSSETAGRLLGIATAMPSVVELIEDLLTPDAGFAIAERAVERKEVGGSPKHLGDMVLGIVRDGKLMRVGDPEADAVEADDQLLYVRTVAGDND